MLVRLMWCGIRPTSDVMARFQRVLLMTMKRKRPRKKMDVDGFGLMKIPHVLLN